MDEACSNLKFVWNTAAKLMYTALIMAQKHSSIAGSFKPCIVVIILLHFWCYVELRTTHWPTEPYLPQSIPCNKTLKKNYNLLNSYHSSVNKPFWWWLFTAHWGTQDHSSSPSHPCVFNCWFSKTSTAKWEKSIHESQLEVIYQSLH